MRRFISLLCCVAILTACAGTGRIESGAAAPNADEAVVIVGVRPAIATIVLYPSEIQDGAVRFLLSRMPAVIDKPLDGYVIGKTKAGDLLALSTINWKEPNERNISNEACGNSPTMVFQTSSGKVIYPGDIIVSRTGNRLSYHTEFNPQAAKKALEARFPQMKDQFVIGQHTFMLTSKKCPRTGFGIPYFLFTYKPK